ncbi:deoxyribonuclease-2-beta isoform X3 [Ambystoma mexicanum]|uniref:deoxyribonuclease-2-beta isoform X3 n=1 Tax=Ambystoma mexicanum TaxID=8296 RepID=UPI0037E98746
MIGSTSCTSRFILYKLPKYKIKENDRTGLEYMYLDSQTPAWQMSMRLVNMTQSVLGITLKQIYQTYKTKDNSTAYLMYNDGRPNSRNYSTKLGHTKGCLLFDKSQGFWLIHSIPRFPPFAEKGYGYPSSGKRNGQTAICVTYKNNQFPEIEEEESLQHAQWHHQKIMARKELWTNKTRQLLIYNPDVYNCSIPEVFHQELSNLQKICLGAHQSWTPRKRLAKLQSAQGEPFLHFAKSHYYIDDIYTAWMAESLETHLLAESWQPTRRALPSNCSLPYHVYNIKTVRLPDLSSFYSHYDHAKWAVSWRHEDQWTCVGDLNREESQIWRSGGFICSQNQYIYKAFRNLVAYYNNCATTNQLGNNLTI